MTDLSHAEPRSQTIFRHTRLMLQHTNMTLHSFAVRIVELYHARVPEPQREIKFMTDGDIYTCAVRNAKHLARYMDVLASSRFPVDMEEPWVLALTEPYQSDCLRDLSGRYELLAVRKRLNLPSEDISSVGRIAAEVGQVLEAMAPIIADGSIDDSDRHLIPKALEELDDLMAATATMRAQLQSVMNASGGR